MAVSILVARNHVVEAARAVPATLERTEIRFGVVRQNGSISVSTPDQIVFLERTSADIVHVTVASYPDWLHITPLTSTAPTRFTIGIRREAKVFPAGAEIGVIRLRLRSESEESELSLAVGLAVLDNRSQAPIGSFDAPGGEIRLTREPVQLIGWALDDVAVEGVNICRDAVPGEESSPLCADGHKTLIGKAALVYDARPDVAAIHRALPINYRGSWLFSLEPRALARFAPGSLSIYAVARDAEGQTSSVGTRIVRLPVVRSGQWQIYLPPALAIVVFAGLHLWLRRAVTSAITDQGESSNNAPRPIHTWEWCVVIAIAAAFVTVQYGQMTAGFQYDELYTASRFVVDVPLLQTATSVGVFNNHIAYSLLGGITTRMFGPSEWAVRLPALVLAVAALIVTWRFARRLSTPIVAVVAIALLAASPAFGEWSHQARGYSGLTLMTLASTYAYLILIERPSRRAAWCHAICSALAIYFHLYGVWIVIVQYLGFVWMTASGSNRAGLRLLWKSFAGAVAVVTVLYLPVAAALLEMLGGRGQTPINVAFPLEMYRSFVGSGPVVMLVAIAATVMIGLWQQRLFQAAYFAACLALPMLVMWLVLRPADLYPRFFVFWTPLFAYLLAEGVITMMRWSATGTSTVARLIAAAAVLVVAVAITFSATQSIEHTVVRKSEGFRSLLQPTVRGWRSVGVGGDAVMFRYYLGEPFQPLQSLHEVNAALHEPAPLQIAYHDADWNAPEQRQIAEMLRRRCAVEDRGLIEMFRCAPDDRKGEKRD